MKATTATAVAAGMIAATLAVAPAAGQDRLDLRRLAGSDRVATAVAVSEAVFEQADTVLLARADDPADALAGAPLAAHLGGPLLLTPPGGVPVAVRAELDRLRTRTVILLGGTDALPAALATQVGDREVRRLAGRSRVETAARIAAELPPSEVAYVAGVGGDVDALAAAAAASSLGRPVLLVGSTDAGDVTGTLDALGVTHVLVVGGERVVPASVAAAMVSDDRTVSRLAGATRYDTAAAIATDAVAAGADPGHVWLATGRNLPDSLAAGPAAAAAGGVLLLVDGQAPWTTRATDDLLSRFDPGRVTVLGGTSAVTDDVTWQLPVMIDGPTLPGGGSAPFPHHRLVAFYGHHATAALGVLGEQPPQQAYDRLVEVAAPFADDGRVVLPTFELIASLATAGAGPDGDYSDPSTREEIQPWLDAARRNGALLLLDLQPGRTDFLTEARRYQDLLREPDVGLALDPEWRLGPDEVHLRQVGSVTAAEVNAVSAWLAEIVREEGLPQKPFVLHQFQSRMIQDRDRDLVLRPELATIVHMDGQGSRAAKLNTYDVLTRTAGPWDHGFKLFYDEDPDIFLPHEVLRLAPLPDMVSYQ